MKIILLAVASDKTSSVYLDNLNLTIDNESVDLSQIPVGGQAEGADDSPLIGKVTRDEVSIRYYYDSAKAESHQSHNIADYTFEFPTGFTGKVPCPIKWQTTEDLEVSEGVEND